MLDSRIIRKDFPIFENQPDLVYLDSAATALKPRVVIDAMNEYYFEYSANVARGLYPLGEAATTALENARKRIADFVHAPDVHGVIFTGNATHGINLVALGLERQMTSTHNIVVTNLEHHSNLLPWKELSRRTGAELRTAPFTPDGKIDKEKMSMLVDEKTIIVALSAVSNVFGVINPVPEIVRSIRKKNPKAMVLVDACQAVGHFRVDFQEWDGDFMVFSGHKLFGPTGIGVLIGKMDALRALEERNVGGGTVLDACSAEVRYKNLPENMEGGTPNIAGALGLAAACEFVTSIGLENIHAHEQALIEILIEKLTSAFGSRIHILGTKSADERAGLLSFSIEGIHPHDLAHLLGEEGICVRAGEHCASPLHRALRLPATTRVSLSIYNDERDIEKLLMVMKKAVNLFSA